MSDRTKQPVESVKRAVLSRESKAIVGFMVAGFTVVLALMLFSASQEAAAYNRMTGGDATTWEALFVELRVDGDR